MNLSNLLWPNDPSIKIGSLDIHAYAIIIVCGMIAAFFIITALFRRRNMSPDLFLTFFVITLPIAIITTRLFYCITDGLPVSQWLSWSSIRQGGLSIVGGIIGGTASVAVICIVKKVNFLRVGDCVVVGLLFAQSVGRWGNFVNQEVYGAQVTNSALQFFPFAVYIDKRQSWHYAFFFYESMVTLLASILMFINGWKNGKKPNGINTACYFIVYGLTRSIMEPLRYNGDDVSYILNGGGVPWSLVMSITMLVGGVGLLFYLLYTNKKKEGKLIGSAIGEPYGIVKFIADRKDELPLLDKRNMMCEIYPENYEAEAETTEKTEKDETAETVEEKESTDEKKEK